MSESDNIIARNEWLFPGIVTVSCLAAAVLYVLYPEDPKPTDPEQIRQALQAQALHNRHLFDVCLLFALAASGVWFAYAFTGDPFQRRSEMVRFAYFFVLASLAILSIPPLVKSQAIGTEPIGIVSGCVRHTQVDQLRCDYTDDERKMARAGRQPPAMPPAGAGAAGSGEQGNAAGGQPGTAAPKAQPGSSAAPPDEEPRYSNQWLVNIGGTLTPQNPKLCKRPDGSPVKEPECKPGSAGNRVFITGGVVVPFPFVIIAMFGGAISLSRRVPEIQKRSEVGYASTADAPALQPSEVRESLAFQILQFVSAPLIAITAHQVIQPENHTTSVALAFMAGFGSEAILVMIRGAFNGIQPKSFTPAAAVSGSVGGTVTDAGQPVEGIDVCIPGSALKNKTDSNGHYLIHDVPAGGRDVIASEAHRRAKASVAIVSGHTAVCDLVLIHSGALKGTVTDAQGQPVAGARVHVNRLPEIKAVTGKDGAYSLEAVPAGEQIIKAETGAGAKKSSGSARVAVRYATTTSCDIRLQ